LKLAGPPHPAKRAEQKAGRTPALPAMTGAASSAMLFVDVDWI
jgi:hypothetical protein